MPGLYLRCDVCEDPKNDLSINEWHIGSGRKTLQEAERQGWQITWHRDGPHVCPSCLSLEALVRGDQ